MPRSPVSSIDGRASSETASWATADRGESITRPDSETLTVVPPEAEEDFEPTEETSLLGAGAQDHHRNGHTDPPPPYKRDIWADDPDFEHLPPWRRPSVWWLLGPFSLFALAFGGSLVPKLNLIIDLVCNRYFSDQAAVDPSFRFAPIVPGGDNPQCRAPGVQKNVATFTLALNVIVGILSTYTSPKLGALSDRYGRKSMMAICSAGGLAGEVITILAAKYPDAIHYRWLVLGSVLDGLAGSFTAGSVLSHSYTSDCTPPSKRSVSIGYMHSCLFSGLAFGPLLASFLVKKTGSLLSIFYVALGCHAFFILFVLFVTPESLSKRKQLLAREKHEKEQEAESSPPTWAARSSFPLASAMGKTLYALKVANPFASLKILVPAGQHNAKIRRNLIAFAVIDMVLFGSAMSLGTITILYSEFMFGWGTVESSRFVSLVSSVRFLVLMAIFPIINYFFRTRPAARKRRMSAVPIVEKNAGADRLDIWILRSALLSDILGVCGYIFVRTEALFVLCGVVTAFGGLGSATIQASITKHVRSERVGQLLGAIGMLQAISRVVAPVVFNGIYAATVESFPQAVFVLLGSLFGLILLASLLIRPYIYVKDDDEPTSAPPPDMQPDPLLDRNSLEDEELLSGLR